MGIEDQFIIIEETLKNNFMLSAVANNILDISSTKLLIITLLENPSHYLSQIKKQRGQVGCE